MPTKIVEVYSNLKTGIHTSWSKDEVQNQTNAVWQHLLNNEEYRSLGSPGNVKFYKIGEDRKIVINNVTHIVRSPELSAIVDQAMIVFDQNPYTHNPSKSDRPDSTAHTTFSSKPSSRSPTPKSADKDSLNRMSDEIQRLNNTVHYLSQKLEYLTGFMHGIVHSNSSSDGFNFNSEDNRDPFSDSSTRFHSNIHERHEPPISITNPNAVRHDMYYMLQDELHNIGDQLTQLKTQLNSTPRETPTHKISEDSSSEMWYDPEPYQSDDDDADINRTDAFSPRNSIDSSSPEDPKIKHSASHEEHLPEQSDLVISGLERRLQTLQKPSAQVLLDRQKEIFDFESNVLKERLEDAQKEIEKQASHIQDLTKKLHQQLAISSKEDLRNSKEHQTLLHQLQEAKNRHQSTIELAQAKQKQINQLTEDYQTQIRKLEAQRDTEKEKVTQLQEQLKIAKQTTQQTLEKQKTLDSRLQKLKYSYQDLEAELRTIKYKYEQANNLAQEKQGQIDQLNAQHQTQIYELEEQRNIEKEKATQLQEQLELAEHTTQQALDKQAQLQTQLTTAQRRAEELGQLNAQHQTQIHKLKRKWSNQKERVTQLQEQLQATKNSQRKALDKQTSLENQLQEAKKQYQTQIRNLAEKRDTEKARVTQLQHQLSTAKNSQRKALDKQAELQTQLITAQQQHKDAMHLAQQRAQEIDQLNAQHQMHIYELEQKWSDQKERVTQLQHQLSTAKNSQRKALDEQAALESQLTKTKQTLTELESAHSREIQQLGRANIDLEQQLHISHQERTQEISKHKSKVHELEKQVQKAQHDAEIALSYEHTARHRLQELATTYQKDLDTMSAQLTDFQSQNQKLTERNRHLEQKEKQVIDQSTQLSLQLQKAEDKIKTLEETLHTQTSSSEEVAAVQIDLEKARQEAQKLRLENAELAQTKLRVHNLEEQLTQAKQEADDYIQENTIALKAQGKEEAEHNMRQILTDLQQKHHTEITELRSKMTELQLKEHTSRTELEQELSRIQELERSASTAINQKDELARIAQELEQRIKTLTKEFRQEKQRLHNEYTQTIDDLHSQITISEQGLQRELQKIKKQHKLKVQELEEKISSRDRLLSNADTERVRMVEHSSELQRSIETSQARIEELEASVDQLQQEKEEIARNALEAIEIVSANSNSSTDSDEDSDSETEDNQRTPRPFQRSNTEPSLRGARRYTT